MKHREFVMEPLTKGVVSKDELAHTPFWFKRFSNDKAEQNLGTKALQMCYW